MSTFRAVGLAVGVWAAAAGGAAPQTAPLNVRIHAQDGRSFPCEPSIAVDPTDPQRLVAGSVLDDVYHSDDGGRTWTVDRMRSRLIIILTNLYGTSNCSDISASESGFSPL